jgi:hypothetical protein
MKIKINILRLLAVGVIWLISYMFIALAFEAYSPKYPTGSDPIILIVSTVIAIIIYAVGAAQLFKEEFKATKNYSVYHKIILGSIFALMVFLAKNKII